MSAIGSTANDAAFSAWVTDVTDVTNRGLVDIILSLMPILSLMVIFAGFDGMTVQGNWTGFFLILGGMTTVTGVVGLWIFQDSSTLRPTGGQTYLREVLYAFLPRSIRENPDDLHLLSGDDVFGAGYAAVAAVYDLAGGDHFGH